MAPAAALPTPGGPGHAGRGLGARALTWREAEQRQQQRGQPGSARGQVPLHSCSVPLGGQSQRRRRRGGAKPPLSAATRRKASIAPRRGTACLLTSSPQTSRDAGRARPRVGGHGRVPPPPSPKLSASTGGGIQSIPVPSVRIVSPGEAARQRGGEAHPKPHWAELLGAKKSARGLWGGGCKKAETPPEPSQPRARCPQGRKRTPSAPRPAYF